MGIENEIEAFNMMGDSRIYNYMSTIIPAPNTFDIRSINAVSVKELYDYIQYNHCYFEVEPKEANSQSKGHEGFIIGRKYLDKGNHVVFFILNICNGDLIKIDKSGSTMSDLMGSASDIGIPGRAGLMSDFITYILGDSVIDNPTPEQIPILFNEIDCWFSKTTNELCDEVERLRAVENIGIKGPKEKIEIKVSEGKKPMVNYDAMKPDDFQIPNKKYGDMFLSDSISMEVNYKHDGEQIKFWRAEIIDEALGFDEEAIFLAVGNILYVFSQIEQVAWIQRLDQEIEGYEMIQCNSLVFSMLPSYFDRLHNETSFGGTNLNETDSLAFKELALLFIGCTNIEIANENMLMGDLMNAVGQILGIRFEKLPNPSWGRDA